MIGLAESLLVLGNKFIEDPDKKAEYAYKTMDRMLSSKTYVWIDALVKLSFAMEQITKGLLRPLGSVAMFGFSAYCTINGIVLPPMIAEMLFGAPLAWGYSRHVEKSKGPKPPTDQLVKYND